jgi:hypothetical protein
VVSAKHFRFEIEKYVQYLTSQFTLPLKCRNIAATISELPSFVHASNSQGLRMSCFVKAEVCSFHKSVQHHWQLPFPESSKHHNSNIVVPSDCLIDNETKNPFRKGNYFETLFIA